MRRLSSAPHRRLTEPAHSRVMAPIASRARTDGSDDSDDPAARDVAMLTGVPAGDMLRTAARTAGGELVRWRARQVQTSGRGAVATYAVTVRWADGRTSDELLAACTGDLPSDALVLDDGDRKVAVWRFPRDPALPGLAAAADEESVAALFADLGLGSGPVRLAVRAYRPLRRAVIEATGPAGRVFIKAVRPDRVEALHRRHRQLVACGVPAPHSFGWTTDGLLVLQALPGRTLRDALRSGTTALPDGDEIVALLDRLPTELVDGGRRRTWLDKIDFYANAVSSILPEQRRRVTRLAESIRAEAGTGTEVTTHGDLYESQLLVHDGRVCGLLDIDTARPGDRLDDLGCLIGHLSALAHLEPANAQAINRIGNLYLARFDRSVDRADLRYRAAAVVVSLVPGPHRVQQPRWAHASSGLLSVAESWVALARAARR